MPAPLTFRAKAIEQTVQAAYDIARFTAEDPVAGLPDAADIAPPDTHRDLDLFHPWAITSEEAAEMARRCEAAAFKTHRRITNSEGAGVSAQQSHFFSAHTRGFRGGYASSRHSFSVAPIASLPGKTARCSATPGTAPCATRPTWPRPRPWAATPPSAP